MTHKEAFAYLADDLNVARKVKDFDKMHAHALRLFAGNYKLHEVTQMISRDHGIKPQVGAVVTAAALAAMDRGDAPPT